MESLRRISARASIGLRPVGGRAPLAVASLIGLQVNWTLAILVSLALFGFYASRAGQPLFGSILGDDR